MSPLSKELVGVVIAAYTADAVTARELSQLLRVVGNQCRQLAVLLRCAKAGRMALGDVAEADDGVADRSGQSGALGSAARTYSAAAPEGRDGPGAIIIGGDEGKRNGALRSTGAAARAATTAFGGGFAGWGAAGGGDPVAMRCETAGCRAGICALQSVPRKCIPESKA